MQPDKVRVRQTGPAEKPNQTRSTTGPASEQVAQVSFARVDSVSPATKNATKTLPTTHWESALGLELAVAASSIPG